MAGGDGTSCRDAGAGGDGGPSADVDGVLEAVSVSVLRQLDSALEDCDARLADLHACGFAATRGAQLVLLQAYRWAIFTGSGDVWPQHLAHALLVQACFSRFRTGFVTDPPAQPALELYALLPGLVCYQALSALQLDLGGRQVMGSPTASTDTAATAAPAAAITGAAVTTAAELLSNYSRSGLLPSRSALDAIAASLETASGATHRTTSPRERQTRASTIGPEPGRAVHKRQAQQGAGEAPPAVRVLCAFAALGYRLPPGALPALVLQEGSFSHSGVRGTQREAGVEAEDEAVKAASAWLTPPLLLEWLAALSFHGAAPEPVSYAPALAGLRPCPGYSGASRVLQACHPWLECSIVACLASATAWELPALAARLTALGAAQRATAQVVSQGFVRSNDSGTADGWGVYQWGVQGGWLRCGARAMELACRACLYITPLWNGNRIYQDLIHVGDALTAMTTVAATVPVVAATGAASVAQASGGAATAATGPAEAEQGVTGQRGVIGSPHGSSGVAGSVMAVTSGGVCGATADEWLAAWAAVELPHQADRWARKLAVRVHKGAEARLGDVPHGEPEWPTFEQAAVLLLQVVRLAAAMAAAQLTREADDAGVGVVKSLAASTAGKSAVADGEASGVTSEAAVGRRLPLPLRSGLLINLLAVLQMQLRTCSAGPEQIALVRRALDELAVLVHRPPLGTTENPAQEGEEVVAASHMAALAAVLGRHADWVYAAETAYGVVASRESEGGGGSSRARDGSDAGRGYGSPATAAAACAKAALLPSVVLSQAYRSWVPDLTPEVAAELHDAVRTVATSTASRPGAALLPHPAAQEVGLTADAAASGTASGLGTAPATEFGSTGAQLRAPQARGVSVLERCLARLHYPLDSPADADPNSSPWPQSTGDRPHTTPDGSIACAEASGQEAIPAGFPPRHVPYASPAGFGQQWSPSLRRGGAVARPSELRVAAQYPDTRNLPALPLLAGNAPRPAHLLQHLLRRHGAQVMSAPPCGSHDGQLDAARWPPGLLVALVSATLLPCPHGDAAHASQAPVSLAATPQPVVTRPTPTGAADGSFAGLPFLSPPGARARRLALDDAALAGLVSELVSGCAPEALRPEELWVLHVADRDACLSTRLRAMRLAPTAPGSTVQKMAASGAAGVAGNFAGGLADRWTAWMDAARDAHIAAVPNLHSPTRQPERQQPAATGQGGSIGAKRSAASNDIFPLVRSLPNSPPTVRRPALPPVCCLELLLLRRQQAPVQALLALMWQGDWFRGDAATLARFRADELLYVMCSVVHLKELEELEEVDLGWLQPGDQAANTVLELLGCGSLAELLSHPAVTWGVGPAGPYAPTDLAQEKRVRSQKLLDAAVGLDECFDRAEQALRYVAVAGPSGVLGGGRLDPYRTMCAQGESVGAFEGHRWVSWRQKDDVGGGGMERNFIGRAWEVGAPGGTQGVQSQEGTSVRGLRARRPPGVRQWEALLGAEGVRRLRWALEGMGRNPDSWMGAV